jgi:hypothetical protein
MIAENETASVVLRRTRGLVTNQNVIKRLGAGLIAYTCNVARWVEERSGIQPEKPRLKIISLLACENSFRHMPSFN